MKCMNIQTTLYHLIDKTWTHLLKNLRILTKKTITPKIKKLKKRVDTERIRRKHEVYFINY